MSRMEVPLTRRPSKLGPAKTMENIKSTLAEERLGPAAASHMYAVAATPIAQLAMLKAAIRVYKVLPAFPTRKPQASIHTCNMVRLLRKACKLQVKSLQQGFVP